MKILLYTKLQDIVAVATFEMATRLDNAALDQGFYCYVSLTVSDIKKSLKIVRLVFHTF